MKPAGLWHVASSKVMKKSSKGRLVSDKGGAASRSIERVPGAGTGATGRNPSSRHGSIPASQAGVTRHTNAGTKASGNLTVGPGSTISSDQRGSIRRNSIYIPTQDSHAGVPYSELSETTFRPQQHANRYVYNDCTYRMSPDEDRRFVAMKVEYVIKDVLESRLKNARYDPDKCSGLTKELCATIKEKTKQLQFDRYKLIAQVILGQDTDQSVQMASRCLWNSATDNFAAATFRNSSIYAVAVVYGVYLD